VDNSFLTDLILTSRALPSHETQIASRSRSPETPPIIWTNGSLTCFWIYRGWTVLGWSSLSQGLADRGVYPENSDRTLRSSFAGQIGEAEIGERIVARSPFATLWKVPPPNPYHDCPPPNLPGHPLPRNWRMTTPSNSTWWGQPNAVSYAYWSTTLRTTLSWIVRISWTRTSSTASNRRSREKENPQTDSSPLTMRNCRLARH